MKHLLLIALGVCTLAGLTGCQHSYGRLSTLQDPKYPITRESKIALPNDKDAPANDVATRLAGETVEAQLLALGFHLVPVGEAEVQLALTIADKDESETYNRTMSTMSNISGMAGTQPVTGTVFSEQIVPQVRTVAMTQLNVTLQRAHDPKVDVWHGQITAEAGAAEKFRPAFFRALLERIGETARGSVQLDSDETKGK